MMERQMTITIGVDEIEEQARRLVIVAMGKTAWEYDDEVVDKIYKGFGKGSSFERLVQLLNRHAIKHDLKT